MFTGLVQGVGRLRAREARGGDVRLHVERGSLPPAQLQMGESIAVNGVCLTVVDCDANADGEDQRTGKLKAGVVGVRAHACDK